MSQNPANMSTRPRLRGPGSSPESGEVVLELSSLKLREPRKLWRPAFIAIYFTRALREIIGNTIETVINVKGKDKNVIEEDRSFASVDRKKLISMTKDQRLDHLQELGGAERIAAELMSNPETGIRGDEEDLRTRMKISVLTDISVLRFYGYIGYIGDISMDIFT